MNRPEDDRLASHAICHACSSEFSIRFQVGFDLKFGLHRTK
jgi:hypothetical protein